MRNFRVSVKCQNSGNTNSVKDLCNYSEVIKTRFWTLFSLLKEDFCLNKKALYLWRNIKARSCIHFYCGKAIIMTRSECVFVAFAIEQAMRIRCTVFHLWPVRHYCIFPHYFTKGMIFGTTFLNIKYVFWFSVQFLTEKFWF